MHKFKIPTICQACEEELVNAINEHKDSAMIWCEHTGMFAAVTAPSGIFVRVMTQGPFDETGLQRYFNNLKQAYEITGLHNAQNLPNC